MRNPEKDRERFESRCRFEKPVWEQGYSRVAGVDEAGRGPLAGPVVAAAVILPRDLYIPGLDDSKRLTPAARERLYEGVRRVAVAWGVGICSVEQIDIHNIYQATVLAMEEAVRNLRPPPDYVITDAVRLPRLDIPFLAVVDGDALSNCVAAASIIAKVTRDRIMMEIDREFPAYGFARHKGYATPEHLEVLRRLGPCRYHRTSFHWESGREALPGLRLPAAAGKK